ncbi:hypothetical protein CO019_00645 [Candidatus Berkelbacteria bacterium CG_4_9_14_0_2_um_filter_42_30]|uniref:Uncharacterized protein n=6 Tax=Candidatus Berkelbacteria TaxID=1618330 RepID=A0A2M7K116_9BACT|nr:MAG: hypothetical protein AUJ40_02930 [Candidatus Berkelbacteria bacterium CG1_02_42_45]PIP50986.1 MAG: hypothetical protein COX11_01095 [Candidatus Berkelbacteria bacterium CG23_combo_of_CG06-09_8_20_14_all_41_73]PIR27438.1 MAG: hypothetical protein COV40_00850 [Candidatus Berkelbacteria bacterium CG11_big_fil_rev_8_21_14_0_20_42_15]PIX29962.1 MAG: hypothetical protein COZ63_02295 [Candidatus Berkelbacteria bacterium CG_4_8_14_3_um_filter_42_13]PIZ27506.1 MAG: hypothetical protein COY45_021
MSEFLNDDMKKYANWKAPDSSGGSPEQVESRIDYGQIKELLTDGSADEYCGYVGAIPIEGALEPLGDERTVDQLSPQERSQTTALFSDYAAQRGFRLEANDRSCIAWAA